MNNDAVSRRRVVITGVGLITPLGHNVPGRRAAILAGRSGFGPLTLVDNPNHTIGGLCEVKNFDPAEYMDRKDARRRDRYQQLAVVAAAEAMRQANLSITDDNRERIGITIGTGVGGGWVVRRSGSVGSERTGEQQSRQGRQRRDYRSSALREHESIPE